MRSTPRIRLEHPDRLAEVALGWPAERVQAAMQGGPNNTSVGVPNKIPVYIVYFTAYARDGALYFGDDVYGRDDALESKMPPDSEGPSPDNARSGSVKRAKSQERDGSAPTDWIHASSRR